MNTKEVSSEQEKYFNIMTEAQNVTIKTIKPGLTATKTKKEVQAFYKKNEVQHITKHNSMHYIGIFSHEAPFFDLGDHTVLKPGMIFSVEPGLYINGLGAFRHSDTVLITNEGVNILTYYPRDLNSLVIG